MLEIALVLRGEKLLARDVLAAARDVLDLLHGIDQERNATTQHPRRRLIKWSVDILSSNHTSLIKFTPLNGEHEARQIIDAATARRAASGAERG